MSNCDIAKTPMDEGAKAFLVPYDGVASKEEVNFYQRLMGSINFLYLTRADISFASGALMRYLTNPSQQHVQAAKRILKYLRGTKYYAIIFGIPVDNLDSMNLHGYSDASHASNDITTWRSHSGWAFFFCGGLVLVSSKRQTTVALSSTEAELYGLCKAAQEAAWIRYILAELHYNEDDAKKIKIYGDNQGALALAENPELHQRTKHIALKWYYLRQQANQGFLDLWYCSTLDMVADGLTKPLGPTKHLEFVAQIQMSEIPHYK